MGVLGLALAAAWALRPGLEGAQWAFAGLPLRQPLPQAGVGAREGDPVAGGVWQSGQYAPDAVVAQPLNPGGTNLVISKVYGGAGCGTAGCSTYKNDFIEIFNPTSGSISVNGWSVQMAGASGGGSWSGTNLPNASIPAGGYFLVREATSTNGLLNLPTPDATGATDMPATAGRVALVNNTALRSGSCPS